jgi:hypothetical protein
MTVQERVKYFVDQVDNGHITFDQVRKQLESEGLDELEIKNIVRLVDTELQNALLTKGKASGADQLILAGGVLTAIGLVVTIGSLLGLFTHGNTTVIAIAYGPLAGGVIILFIGLRRKKRKTLPKELPSKTFGKRIRSHSDRK